MSKYNYGFVQRNSRGDVDIVWLGIQADNIHMARVLAGALSDSVWHWPNVPVSTLGTIQSILNRLHIPGADTELNVNSIDENHHTLHLVDFENDQVMLIDDTFNGNYLVLEEDEIKVTFSLSGYIQRFLNPR